MNPGRRRGPLISSNCSYCTRVVTRRGTLAERGYPELLQSLACRRIADWSQVRAHSSSPRGIGIFAQHILCLSSEWPLALSRLSLTQLYR